MALYSETLPRSGKVSPLGPAALGRDDGYSGLNPDSFSNAVLISTSALMKAANAAGPRAVGTMPSDVVFSMKPGSLETSAIAEASLSTTGSGVPLGAHRPYQELMKKSFSPTSWAVGMLGASDVRSLEVTNRARARPEV